MKPEDLAYRTNEAREALKQRELDDAAREQRAREEANAPCRNYRSINEGLPHGSFEWF